MFKYFSNLGNMAQGPNLKSSRVRDVWGYFVFFIKYLLVLETEKSIFDHHPTKLRSVVLDTKTCAFDCNEMIAINTWTPLRLQVIILSQENAKTKKIRPFIKIIW